MTRRIYPKPPIVEAIISLHFQSPAEPKALAQTLAGDLQHRYDDEELRAAELVQASFRAELDGGVSASARRMTHAHFLRSASGLRLLGFGPGVLSVHTLAPYPGWESFIEQAEEAVDALPEQVRSSSLQKIGVRYIDLILLPPNEGYETFFNIMPPRPPALPDVLSNYYHFTQSSDPEDGTVAQLTVVNTVVPDHTGIALLYDLTLYRAADPLASFATNDWRVHVEELHTRLRDIFEASITDSTRALFQ